VAAGASVEPVPDACSSEQRINAPEAYPAEYVPGVCVSHCEGNARSGLPCHFLALQPIPCVAFGIRVRDDREPARNGQVLTEGKKDRQVVLAPGAEEYLVSSQRWVGPGHRAHGA